jgi:hypothetical protein
MSDEPGRLNRPRYLNGPGVTNEDLMDGIYEVREQLGEIRREIQELESPMNRTADNTARIAESLEGLIDKATDRWKVPLPAFLVVVVTMAVMFGLYAVAILKSELHLTPSSLQIGAKTRAADGP